jgi:hypothetical protein
MEENLSKPNEIMNTSLLDISVIITTKNNKPAIELRRLTQDLETIKKLVSCAYHNQPIILMPRFSDTTQSLSSLVEKGILYYNEGRYYFNF